MAFKIVPIANDPKANQVALRTDGASSPKVSHWILCLLLLLPLTGCRGCFSTSTPKPETQAEKDKKKEEQKRRLSLKNLRAEPSVESQNIFFLKPGHWLHARQEAKANQGDESLDVSIEITDRRLDPIPLRGTGTILEFNREVSIAKGQSKSSEMMFFVPELPAELDENGLPAKPTVKLLYSQRGLGTPVAESPHPSNISPPEQYVLVTLSKDPPRHAYWPGLSCVVWPSNDVFDDTLKISPHRVVDVKESEAALLLPSRAVAWTSISHLVWYDADPTLLSDLQKESIEDWIYQGGTLVLSGPDVASVANNSFLAKWLPLKELENAPLSKDLAMQFSKRWSVPAADGKVDDILLPSDRDIPSFQGNLVDGGQWVNNCDGLVASRLVGNGRVVMTTFPLSDDAFVRWPSFSSFVNGAILGHPPRQWLPSDLGGSMAYVEEFRGRETDPAFSTRLRLLSRDLSPYETIAGKPVPAVDAGVALDRSRDPALVAMNVPTNENRPQTRSYGSWNDTSPMTTGAVGSLTAASGITVPKVDMIIKLLAGYLLILVPVNWLVFRLIGRVELAWVAAPILALVGAAVVARSVQLDIGFSRSENRLASIELHAGYPRAHVASYTSLYTSLSTNYRAMYTEDTGVVLPLVSSERSSRGARDLRRLQYQYASADGNGLTSFPVRSNSTGMIHAEEMVDLQGSISATFDESGVAQVEVQNSTKIDVHGFAVCGASKDGQWYQAWVGELPAGSKKKVELQVGNGSERWIEQWDSEPISKKQSAVLESDGSTRIEAESDGTLSIGLLLEATLRGAHFKPGKFLGLGWSSEPIGNLEISPRATQRSFRSMICVHLTPGVDPLAQPDQALPGKVTSFDEDSELDKQIQEASKEPAPNLP